MLHRMAYQGDQLMSERCASVNNQPSNIRDEEKDMVKAIELLYAFKRDLSKLHPLCTEAITRLISERHF